MCVCMYVCMCVCMYVCMVVWLYSCIYYILYIICFVILYIILYYIYIGFPCVAKTTTIVLSDRTATYVKWRPWPAGFQHPSMAIWQRGPCSKCLYNNQPGPGQANQLFLLTRIEHIWRVKPNQMLPSEQRNQEFSQLWDHGAMWKFGKHHLLTVLFPT
jgi:hypothetical protein